MQVKKIGAAPTHWICLEPDQEGCRYIYVVDTGGKDLPLISPSHPGPTVCSTAVFGICIPAPCRTWLNQSAMNLVLNPNIRVCTHHRIESIYLTGLYSTLLMCGVWIYLIYCSPRSQISVWTMSNSQTLVLPLKELLRGQIIFYKIHFDNKKRSQGRAQNASLHEQGKTV